MRVTVLGTGIMGSGIARSLLREGHEVTVWNRTAERAAALAADGAVVEHSAAAAVAGAEAVLTLLFDADSVLEVVGGVDLPGGCVWLQSSTVGLDGIARIADHASTRGLGLLDAPVLGTRAPAEQGTLVALVSGDPATVETARPVLDAISSRTVVVGPEVGAASALKMVCNAWVGTITAALGQSVALAEGLGLDPRLFLAAIEGGPVDAPYVRAKAGPMLSGDYPPSFTVRGAEKDLGLIVDAVRRAGVDDDLAQVVRGLFRRARDAGHGGDDMAAVRTARG